MFPVNLSQYLKKNEKWKNYIKGYLRYWTLRTRASAELPKEDMKGQGRIGDPFPVKTSLGYNLGLSFCILLFLLPFYWAEDWHASTPWVWCTKNPGAASLFQGMALAELKLQTGRPSARCCWTHRNRPQTAQALASPDSSQGFALPGQCKAVH